MAERKPGQLWCVGDRFNPRESPSHSDLVYVIISRIEPGRDHAAAWRVLMPTDQAFADWTEEVMKWDVLLADAEV